MGPLIAQAANTGLGILTGAIENEMQFGLQKRLNAEQLKNSKNMMDFQQMKQMEMWEKTGYGAQMEQMAKAGLNPGLMYGMSGGGAQTTGNISATAQGGQASRANIATMTGMGIQQQLAQAQIKHLEAQADLTTAQAEKTKGTDTAESQARIEALQQGVDNERQRFQLLKLEETLKQIENFEKQATQENRMEFIEYQTRQAMKHLEIVENEAFISNATINEKIAIIGQEALGAAIRNALTQAQIKLTAEQITQMKEHIKQGWKGLSLQTDQQAINKFEAELKQAFPGIMNVGGRIINDAIESVFRIISGKPRGNFGRSTPEPQNK